VHISEGVSGGSGEIEVSDLGIGLPNDFDIHRPRASLGFKVIKSLLAHSTGTSKWARAS
jgi:hypothetical protein